MRPLKEIADRLAGLWSLVAGLFITGKYFFQPQITVHYPREVVPNLNTFRGHVELVPKDDDPTMPKCIACGACSRICPSQCLYVGCEHLPKDDAQIYERRKVEDMGGYPVAAKLAKTPPPKKLKCKTPQSFYLNFALCSLCGQCVRACPVDSLRFSNNAFLAGYTREEFSQIDLMQRFHSMYGEPAPAEEASATEQGRDLESEEEREDTRAEAFK